MAIDAKWKCPANTTAQKCRLTTEREMKEIMAMHARNSDKFSVILYRWVLKWSSTMQNKKKLKIIILYMYRIFYNDSVLSMFIFYNDKNVNFIVVNTRGAWVLSSICVYFLSLKIVYDIKIHIFVVSLKFIQTEIFLEQENSCSFATRIIIITPIILKLYSDV